MSVDSGIPVVTHVATHSGLAKPRLVYVHYRYESIPQFVIAHTKEHQKCLAEFFDVTLIDHDCDYGEICDKYLPDVTLFESGLAFTSCRRPNVANVNACPKAAKLGFLHSDGFCESRPGFLSDMDRWGVTTFFTIATTAAAYTPEIADRLYFWPNFIDSDRFHDYGEPKSIPVLFTGNHNELYPWRRRLFKQVSKYYPSMICPHPGYDMTRKAAQAILGESYARLLNRAWFVPACGTAAVELVRKHFEIPGCRACLITQKSAVLESAGFADMQNCIFADEHAILDKLAYLFAHPDELQKIIDQGYDLVQSRHTLKHRDQMLQWLQLHRTLQDGEKIVQDGPFAPLRVVPANTPRPSLPTDLGGIHLRKLHEGYRHLHNGLHEQAEREFLTCLNYHRLMPEPQFGLALCDLHRGIARSALARIMRLLQFTLAEYKATDPDPVEWAYYIVCLLCLGKLAEAVERSREFPWLHHRELDRVRRMVGALHGQSDLLRAVAATGASADRVSVHPLPDRTWEVWLNHVCSLLRLCGQHELANRVLTSASEMEVKENAPSEYRRADSHKTGARAGVAPQPSQEVLRVLNRRMAYSRWRQRVRATGKNVAQRVERAFRCFLPYPLSIRRNDEMCRAVEAAVTQDVSTVLIIGADPRQWITEATIASLSAKSESQVLCLRMNTNAGGRSHPHAPGGNGIVWHEISGATQHIAELLQQTIAQFKTAAGLTAFDVIVVDGSELPKDIEFNEAVLAELDRAKCVVVDDTNNPTVFALGERLSHAEVCRIAESDPLLRQGYAIFER